MTAQPLLTYLTVLTRPCLRQSFSINIPCARVCAAAAQFEHHDVCVQVGVQLLLFGLGMEFSIEKLKEVGSVAIIGGFIQIFLFIAIAAIGALSIGAALSEGIFVGALISMSSTSIVIKSLGERAGDRSSQIVVGTLILQDCTVGLMFALMPVLASLKDPKNGLDPDATGQIVVLILTVRRIQRCPWS
jgi:Kef-type K+ transport system membrane component KefB